MQNEKKKSFGGSLKKKIIKEGERPRFPCKTMLSKFLGSILPRKKRSKGCRKKKLVGENPHHAPQMINGQPLMMQTHVGVFS